MTHFEEISRKIKIIVSEVDAVVTNGFAEITDAGIPFSKSFCLLDFEAINILKKHFKFVFMSADNYVSYNFMRNKNIPFFWAKQSKAETLKEIMKRYNVGPDEVIYIGSMYSDVECFERIPFSICVAESPKELKEIAYVPIEEFGGNGIISKVLDLLKPEINRRRRSS